jgi:hypothetical protein
LPLPGLPVKPQESPVEIFGVAADGTPFIIAELFINHEVRGTAAMAAISVDLMQWFR